MSSTNKTTYYELSQYVGSDKPTYLGDYNSDMLKIDTGLHAAADAADTAVTTANAANSAATSASTTASTALSTAQSASTTASQAQTTAETALTNAGSAQTAASNAETAARANTITNLAPAYDASLTYAVDDLVTYIDAQGSGKMYKCIVAVTAPEAFNINKWDDVTISDVFSYTKLIRIINSDGVKTYRDILNDFSSYIVSTSDYTLCVNDDTQLEIFRYSQFDPVNNNFKFTCNHADFSSTKINSINISATTSNYYRVILPYNNTGASMSYLDDTVAPLGITFTLLKNS